LDTTEVLTTKEDDTEEFSPGPKLLMRRAYCAAVVLTMVGKLGNQQAEEGGSRAGSKASKDVGSRAGSKANKEGREQPEGAASPAGGSAGGGSRPGTQGSRRSVLDGR